MRLSAIAAALGDEFAHHIISLDGDISASDALAGATIEAIESKKSAGVSLANARRLGRIIAASGADILCTYNFGSLEAALANLWGLRRPHVHHEDGFGPDETPDRQKFRRVAFRRLTLRRSVTVVPSRTLEAVALQTWRLPSGRVRRIPNGIDVQKFAAAARVRKGGPLTVGSVGALRPEKNLARLIRVFAANGLGASLHIYGDGPEREKLAAMAAQSEGRVTLKGRIAAPEHAYAAFDIFALSSDTEQMPLSLMEAMAAGLPAVATDVGDVREMLAPENRALVVPPHDEAAFGAALGQLLEDAPARASVGLANAEKARRDFALAGMIAAHAALYRDVLAGAGAR